MKSLSCILHFMQIISGLENAPWFYPSRVALRIFFRHLQHLVHFKPSLSRDDLEPVLFRAKPLAQQLDNKQELPGLLSLCSACQAQGGSKTLPWSSLCPGFGQVKHHNHHTAHTESSSAGQGNEEHSERLTGQDKDREITQQSPSQNTDSTWGNELNLLE